MKRFLTLIVTVLLFIVAIVLGLKNQQIINVNYLVAQSDMRLATLLAIIFLFGFFVAIVFASLFYLKVFLTNKKGIIPVLLIVNVLLIEFLTIII